MSSDDRLLPLRLDQGRVLPSFLGAADHIWLRALLDEHERFAGRPVGRLDERLRAPLPCDAPPVKLRLAVRVLRGLLRTRPAGSLPPRAVRRALFLAAASDGARTREAVVAQAASELEATPEEVERSLFADLRAQQLVEPFDPTPDLADLCLRSNLALVKTLLARSTRLSVELAGASRPVVRHARLRGLIVTVEARGDDGARLELSGPFALFRRTLLYGRALGELVPFLVRCDRFTLEAEISLPHGRGTLQLRSGDPIFPAAESQRYDSRLEACFAKDFAKIAPDWDLVREPAPVDCGTTLVFPDFLLRHRFDPSRSWLVEIAGFWTPGYLDAKLSRLAASGIDNLVLCIDESRNCDVAAMPPRARIVRFRRRVPAEEVLAILEPATGAVATRSE